MIRIWKDAQGLYEHKIEVKEHREMGDEGWVEIRESSRRIQTFPARFKHDCTITVPTSVARELFKGAFT